MVRARTWIAGGLWFLWVWLGGFALGDAETQIEVLGRVVGNLIAYALFAAVVVYPTGWVFDRVTARL